MKDGALCLTEYSKIFVHIHVTIFVSKVQKHQSLMTSCSPYSIYPVPRGLLRSFEYSYFSALFILFLHIHYHFQQSEEAPELGDIMFSLSYLPSAERLTVVILKTRNLRAVKLLEDKKTSG